MTYRERRERRLEQRRDWAGSRAAKADAAQQRVHEIADMIPFGQPVLVGHHSEGRHRRDIGRIQSGMAATVENARMADRHAEAASTIETQLATSIYDDDPDAVERLGEKIAGLEAERDRFKAYNASCRKGSPDESLLDDKQRANLETVRRVCAYQLGKKGELSYTNLTANIGRLKKRLEQLQTESTRVERPRHMFARFASTCDECGETIEKGSPIHYYKRERRAIHAAHGDASAV